MTPLAPGEDVDLVQASLDGDRDAFGHIVSRYQSLVCSLAYSATGSLTHSEDLAQETFVTAWKHLADLREPAKLRPWLCGIARNVVRNFLRREGREPSHAAESLDELADTRSPEPQPAERAITDEEARILWRSLERIPDLYREPLVLFYREQQSVGAVATNLDLTEDAVRQRLSRGRKLLQEEVLGFVEAALEKSSPGKAFTVAVVAALQLTVSTAKAAAVGAAVAKGSAGAKGALGLASAASWLGIFGAIFWMAKLGVDDSRSPRERRLMLRAGAVQVAVVLLTLLGIGFGIDKLPRNPVAICLMLVGVLVVNGAVGIWIMTSVNRQRTQIQIEEGNFDHVDWVGNDDAAKRNRLRKVTKLTVPFVLMFAVGTWGLPWKQHWIRSAIITAGEASVIAWSFWRFQRLFAGEIKVPKTPIDPKRVWLKPVLVILGTMGGAMVFSFALTLFLHPESAQAVLSHYRPALPKFGICALLAFGALIVFAKLAWKRLPSSMTAAAAVQEAYGPFFDELQLTPDDRKKLIELLPKKTMASVRKTLSLMNRRLDTARRAEVCADCVREQEGCAEELRQLLGDEDFQRFKEYEISVPDRTFVNKFAAKLAGKETALTVEKKNKLREALTEARAAHPWATEISRRKDDTADHAVTFSAAQLDLHEQEEEEFGRQFLVRARDILSEAQAEEFQKFQKSSLKSQLRQARMAGKMLGFSRSA
jgi:RNA polymerase sigma factor (sigma-70 family)